MLTIFRTLVFTVLSSFLLAGYAVAQDQYRPTVYLTFDDGPSADSSTDELLDLLAYYGAKATFFVTGQRVRKEPEKISAILYAGHAIGNHSHSHVALVGQSEALVRAEFESANEAVFDAGGPPLACFRAPYGAVDRDVEKVAESLGMRTVKWSVDTRDWEANTQRADIIRVLSTVKDGAIVLMHDGPSKRARTIAALGDWLAEYSDQYRFAALPQCKSYGTSEVFATYDEQEADLPLEEEDIRSLLEKLRSYRFSLDTEQANIDSPYAEKLAARVF